MYVWVRNNVAPVSSAKCLIEGRGDLLSGNAPAADCDDAQRKAQFMLDCAGILRQNIQRAGANVAKSNDADVYGLHERLNSPFSRITSIRLCHHEDMRYIALLVLLSLSGAYSQSTRRDSDDDDIKLPNGKSWNDAIAKADYERNLKDARELARLSAEIRDELENSAAFVLSLKTLKKVEDAEKLAKSLHSRMNKN